MAKDVNNIKLEEALLRWAGEVYPSKEEFAKALKSKKLVIYHGVDPTAPQLHLGHSTNYLLLKKLQEAGHRVILLIGDFTAQIGDPTGKSAVRKSLTKKEVLANCKTYKNQAGKILDFTSRKNPVKLAFNGKWLEKMTLKDVIKLTANFTHGQMIKRNMFQERISKSQEIYIHEFLYPLLQGYDSVALNVDAEVGGTDQTFNMLVGRDLLKIYKNKEKFVITTPLLENPKTGKKMMSKSEGDFVALNDSPKDMYGKIMAMPDETIVPCFKFCTEVPIAQISDMDERLEAGDVNPRDLKARLAKEITTMYHGEKVAERAEEEFNNVFKNKELPEDILEVKISETKLPILDLLVKTGLVESKSEAKRLVEQKGVKIDNNVEEDWQKDIEIESGMVIKIGKRRFAKIK